MENRICVDTDIIIDHLRGRGTGAGIFAKVVENADPLTTQITRFELLCGARSHKEIEVIGECLLGFTVLPFDDSSSKAAGDIYRELKKHGQLIGIRDIMIAGIALSNDLPFVTNNIREFKKVKGLRLAKFN